jgi:hypothetical protein
MDAYMGATQKWLWDRQLMGENIIEIYYTPAIKYSLLNIKFKTSKERK